MEPITGVDPFINVKVDELMLEGSIILLNVAFNTLSSGTSIASSIGSVLRTTGSTGSTKTFVVNFQM